VLYLNVAFADSDGNAVRIVNAESEKIVLTENIVVPSVPPGCGEVNSRFELGILTEIDPVVALRAPSVNVVAPTTVVTSLVVPSRAPMGIEAYDVIVRDA
jgi:hypothetical protein